LNNKIGSGGGLRQIVLDTETTGLNAKLGDRIIEIGCVELGSRRFTGNNWHHYVNPERKSELAALEVHGISDESLLDKPKFIDLAKEFADYISGAELIIHNAAFDVEFLNLELQRAGLETLDKYCTAVFDTLGFAKELYPGKRNSLDSLCERYFIDNSHRTSHGALLDATLLAEVYLAMTRGQDSLAIELEAPRLPAASVGGTAPRVALLVVLASSEECIAHGQVLERIQKESKGKCLWKQLELAELPNAA
jgi:DNA polymerase-3 subunit epsilon